MLETLGRESAHAGRSCAPIKRSIVKENETEEEENQVFALLAKNGKLLHMVHHICPQLKKDTHT